MRASPRFFCLGNIIVLLYCCFVFVSVVLCGRGSGPTGSPWKQEYPQRSELRFNLLCMFFQVAVEEGVLFGAGKILQYQKMISKDDARTYFLPNAEAMDLVSQVASMVNSQSVKLGAIGTEYVGMQEYMEALAWPKDSDTGLR